jgi:hypothetical protein
MHRETIQHLLIARERLRPGTSEAYDQNELQLARVCAELKCPHPYLALLLETGPAEIWWLNAFTSGKQRDDVERAYARNEALMAAMRPLGKRKEDFRETFTSTMTTFRQDLSSGSVLQIAARFFVIRLTFDERNSFGAVFESPAGERFVIADAKTQTDAHQIAARSGPGAMIFSVQPQWSFPAETWIQADPEFWNTAKRAGRG